jgi:phosphoglycolate phosphatase
LLTYLLEREGLSASNCVMIGDRRQDVEGARANGVTVIGAAWGYGAPRELVEADGICQEPADLPELLQTL